jgi:hypothetical protein
MWAIRLPTKRWARTVKKECLDQLILFGERSRRHALQEFLAHHQHESNHQGLANIIHFILLSLGLRRMLPLCTRCATFQRP